MRRAPPSFASCARRAWSAIDGSKFRAAASRKAVPSIGTLERQVGEYLVMLEQSDAAEGTVAGPAPEAIQVALAQLEQARQVGPGRALTEPEARLLQGTKGPAYNLQSAVDAKHGVIVAHAVTEEATDNRSLQPMAEAARDALGAETLKARRTDVARRYVTRHLHDEALQAVAA